MASTIGWAGNVYSFRNVCMINKYLFSLSDVVALVPWYMLFLIHR